MIQFKPYQDPSVDSVVSQVHVGHPIEGGQPAEDHLHGPASLGQPRGLLLPDKGQGAVPFVVHHFQVCSSKDEGAGDVHPVFAGLVKGGPLCDPIQCF